MIEKKYVVELEKKVWIAPISGDPGRTVVLRNARQYKTMPAAKAALTRARKYRLFQNAKIYGVTLITI